MATTSHSLEVLGSLGSGGMAEVQLALLDGREHVAVKRMHPLLASTPETVRHFEQEASIGGLLVHENVVALRDYGRDAQGPYLILEYVEGHSLAMLLDRLGKAEQQISLPAALSVARDTARGLQYAHQLVDPARGVEAGIIHRDISAENVLLSRNGTAKLSDFGIARVVGATRLTRTGFVKGKLGQIAPELFDGSEATRESDVFALGSTLFHAFCGVAPFRGRTDAELIRAVTSASPPRPTLFRPELAPELERWLLSSLAREPAARSTLDELLKAVAALAPDEAQGRRALAECLAWTFPEGPALQRVTRGASLVETRRERSASHAKQRTWLWGAGAALAVGALAVSGWAWLGTGPPPAEDPSHPQPLPGPRMTPVAAPREPPAPEVRPVVVEPEPEPPAPAPEPAEKPIGPLPPLTAMEGMGHGVETAYWDFGRSGVILRDLSLHGHDARLPEKGVHGSLRQLAFERGNHGIRVPDHSDFEFPASFSLDAGFTVDQLPAKGRAIIVARGEGPGGIEPFSLSVKPQGTVEFAIQDARGNADSVSAKIPKLGEQCNVHANFWIKGPQNARLELIINMETVAAKTTQLRPASRLRRDRHPAVRLGGSELEEAGLVGALAHVSVEESVWERSGQGYRTIFP